MPARPPLALLFTSAFCYNIVTTSLPFLFFRKRRVLRQQRLIEPGPPKRPALHVLRRQPLRAHFSRYMPAQRDKNDCVLLRLIRGAR